ncbi:MAG: DUF4437 domain-containing protein [Alphaproteobacteria bacterium]|nr:DUF4437 domain-containing protein [Alphaproteobacteria bacterium]
MARPHIEFVPAQFLPWQRGLYEDVRPGVETRVLSRDFDTGAASLMLRYPAGFARPEREHLSADEEFFVLDGIIEINGQRYDRHCYGFYPAGYVRYGVYSGAGAVVLTFFSREPRARSGIPIFGPDPARVVRCLDTRRMVPSDTHRASMFPGIKPSGTVHKRLKTDPATDEVTWLVLIRGGWAMTQNEIHPCVEEEFTIAGEMVGPHGTMRPGAYFWRPPGIEHGPFASATGTIHFIRGLGGRYTTKLREVAPSPWNVPYDPILPPDYRQHVAGYRDLETCY